MLDFWLVFMPMLRIDVEARMCWPGPHQQNCEERGKHIEGSQGDIDHYSRSSDKLQCAIYYAIDGDQVRSLIFSSTFCSLQIFAA